VEERNAYRILMRMSEGKNHYEDLEVVGRISDVGWVGMDWIHLAP
jgi:hypothetical protein